MGDRSFDPGRALPCGRTVGELLGFHSDGEPAELAEHVAGCPHCRRELAVLDAEWAPVRRAARVPVEPPHGLVERALLTVRGVRGASGASPAEIEQDRGRLRVSPQTVVLLTRRLAGEVLTGHPGVHLRGCTGDVDEVRVDLAVRYPLPAPRLAEAVRRELDDAVRAALGPAAPSVRVRVSDVAPPDAQRPHNE